MLGYWDNPEDTKAIIDETRWLHSGDIAVMDENGYVSIVGRIKDLIIRGGENISPKEIEDFLIVHEGVSDVQVIGVYSEKYGEEVMAWIFSVPNVKLCSRCSFSMYLCIPGKGTGPLSVLIRLTATVRGSTPATVYQHYRTKLWPKLKLSLHFYVQQTFELL